MRRIGRRLNGSAGTGFPVRRPSGARHRGKLIPVTYIDEAILDVTEWCCRRFQVLTGRTNTWLAVQLTNLSIAMYFVWAAVYFWQTELWLRVSVAAFCGGVLYALTKTIFRVPIEESEANAYRRVAKGLRNPRRVRDALLRMSFVTLCVVLASPTAFVYAVLGLRSILLSYFLIAFTTLLLYVLACDPLPPCAGTIREWVRGFSSSAAPEPASDAVVVPRPPAA